MSVKRNVVDKRLTLFRTCGICGKSVTTTADTPWVRQVPRDGKRQATTYYCSTTCYQASYKYKGWYDGKTEERRREREKKRPDRSAYNRQWRDKNRDHIREYNRERERQYRLTDPDGYKADKQYQYRKARLKKKQEVVV